MKNLIISFLIVSCGFGTVNASRISDYTSNSKKTSIEKTISIRQYVMVTMKDGTLVKAIVLGRVSNNKFWVRKVGDDRQGIVHKKHITPISKKSQAK